MKFRTYIIVALSATAFVPFVAWSVLHLGDMERRIAEADLEQHSATVDAAALVEERLQGINAVVELADRTLAHSALKKEEISICFCRTSSNLIRSSRICTLTIELRTA